MLVKNIAIAEETENAEDDDVSVENYESHYSLQHSGGSRSSLASGNIFIQATVCFWT